ncbi:Lcl domain-containing protein [Vibrio coralliilyticus]|uniref:Lcl domain-containing protein n=1 Tax=Vibrio coralliilyticus TaxID=190893 RepID=UPI002B4C1952|nr:DUF1566 domain-containing protein [Vibrio coralliilyticus]MCC2525787.1 DUF1566 domain-containing protein [Vibrio coralliilyticus]
MAYSENGSYGPAGFDFARFRQDGQGGDTTTGEGGQFDRYCADLATRAFAGKSDWRRPTSSELTQLYNTHGNMWSALGWPTNYYYWSSTPNGSNFDYVYLGNGNVRSISPSISYYASCVSGS